MAKYFTIRFCSFAIHRGKLPDLCTDGWNVLVTEIANFTDLLLCDIINKLLYLALLNLILHKHNSTTFELIYKYKIGFLKLP